MLRKKAISGEPAGYTHTSTPHRRSMSPTPSENESYNSFTLNSNTSIRSRSDSLAEFEKNLKSSS